LLFILPSFILVAGFLVTSIQKWWLKS
jgi:hypothetical protein